MTQSEQVIEYWIGNKSNEQTFGTIKILPFSKVKTKFDQIAHIPKVAATSPAEQKLKTDSVHLCLYSVPIELVIKDFCEFSKVCEPYIEEMRVAIGSSKCTYLILILAKSKEAANVIVNTIHGLKFSEFFEGYCNLATILLASKRRKNKKNLEREEAKDIMNGPECLFSNDSLSCPICLEKFSVSTDNGYRLSILCGHYYHSVCLANCNNELCPLCRALQSPGESNKCEICGAADNLWLCLICGFVGCWDNSNPVLSHSRIHYDNSMHTYALSVETKKVWDYAKEGYVHRLIQNKADGKMIEFEDVELQRQVPKGSMLKLSMKKNYYQQLDAVNHEYNILLMSELEKQKKYFDAKLRSYESEAIKIKEQTIKEMTEKKKNIEQMIKEIELEEEKNTLIKKENEELHSKFTAFIKEDFQRKLENETLKEKLDELKKKLKIDEFTKAKHNKVKELDAKIENLRNELKDIRFHVSTQSTVKKTAVGGQMLIFNSKKHSKRK
jgi:BRCA1-associated protein